MIFVTVGSMFPFDRLIQVMDEWTAANGRDDIFAQIGTGSYEPKHMRWARRLDQAEFSNKTRDAELIVAHAGMGSVITADQYGRPIVLLPRIQEWGEHTTDHQLATAKWLRGKPGIHVADTSADLGPTIDRVLAEGDSGGEKWSRTADPEFLKRIRAYIDQAI